MCEAAASCAGTQSGVVCSKGTMARLVVFAVRLFNNGRNEEGVRREVVSSHLRFESYCRIV